MNGTLDYSFASSTPLFRSGLLGFGALGSASYAPNGIYVDNLQALPYCAHTANFTAPGSAYATDTIYYNTALGIMYSGYNGNWTACQTLFMGEALVGASTISSVLQYALNGQTMVTQSTLAVSTQYSFADNLGTTMKNISHCYLVNKTPELGYVAGDKVGLFRIKCS